MEAEAEGHRLEEDVIEDLEDGGGLIMQRPEGSYIPDFLPEHLDSINGKKLPAKFDKTCIVLVQNRKFYNPDGKGADDIVVRPWHPADIDVLKCLHEDWFPIRYKEDFYTHAVQQKIWNSEKPLFTIVATDPHEPNLPPVSKRKSTPGVHEDSDAAMVDAVGSVEGSTADGLQITQQLAQLNPQFPAAKLSQLDTKMKILEPLPDIAPSPAPPPPPPSQQKSATKKTMDTGRIVGAVTAQIVHVDDCEDANLFSDDSHTHVQYILTLGVDKTHRRRGISSMLLQKCEDHVHSFNRQKQRESDEKNRFNFFRKKVIACGALYLHVITYNDSAIRFYEKNGFKCLRRARNYYLIDGEHYDSLLYIKYMSAPPPLPIPLVSTISAADKSVVSGTTSGSITGANGSDSSSPSDSSSSPWGWGILARPFTALSGVIFSGWRRLGFNTAFEKPIAIENA